MNEAKRNLEHIIHSDPPTSEKGKRALSNLLPLSRSTVHRWILKSGCKYAKASASYYTDSYEAEETKQDFRTRYGPAQLRHSIRMPMWVSVPRTSATAEALANRSAVLRENDIEVSSSDSKPLVKVHVDYLDENTHAERCSGIQGDLVNTSILSVHQNEHCLSAGIDTLLALANATYLSIILVKMKLFSNRTHYHLTTGRSKVDSN